MGVLAGRGQLGIILGGAGLPAAILAQSPVGYWKLDETSGTTAIDSSGNGRNGTYAGTYTLNNVNGLCSFAGGYVEIADNDAWTIGASGLSVWALCKPTASVPNRAHIVAKGDVSNYEYAMNVEVGSGADALGAVAWSLNGNNQMSETSAGSLITTAWQGVAFAMPTVVYGTRFPIYRNSSTPISSSQGVFYPESFGNGTAPLRIALRGDGVDGFTGAIGHVAVFASKLSDASIGTIMSAAQREGWF